jgi:hypothetical protein
MAMQYVGLRSQLCSGLLGSNRSQAVSTATSREPSLNFTESVGTIQTCSARRMPVSRHVAA